MAGGSTTVTEAVADLVESAVEVAMTDTSAGLGTADGAVYSPFVDMVPQAVPVQPAPLRLHDTAVLAVPVTVALNCRWALVATCAAVGEIVTPTGGIIVTEAVADFVGSATEVAVMDICAGLGTAAGAVYSPLVDIVPQAAPVQPLPMMLHVTAVFVELVTVAVN